MTKKKPKKRNPTDLTLRNLRALKKKLKFIEMHHQVLFELIQGRYGCFSRLNQLEHRVKALEEAKKK